MVAKESGELGFTVVPGTGFKDIYTTPVRSSKLTLEQKAGTGTIRCFGG